MVESLFQRGKQVFDQEPPTEEERKNPSLAVVLGSGVLTQYVTDEIRHAVGCGCGACKGVGGIADSAMDFLTYPQVLGQTVKEGVKEGMKNGSRTTVFKRK